MPEGYGALTDKEKETLRLIVRGHDAKSLARHLGLSVHTVNERLRDARRKLGVSSSREAARLLLQWEHAHPQNPGDKSFGEANDRPPVAPAGGPDATSAARPRLALLTGGTLMMLSLAIVSLLVTQPEPEQPATTTPSSVPSASAVTMAALDWLALVDRQQWRESWDATGSSFRKLNTVQAWQSASEQARVPLGAVLQRTAASREYVPAPPYGYEMVRFRTSFQNKPDVTETLSLVQEGGRWRVVGYIIG